MTNSANRKLLVAMAEELSSLSQTGDALQSLVTSLMSANRGGEHAVRDAQLADVLSQHLQELGRLIENYVRASDADHPDPLQAALSEVTLGALVARLSDDMIPQTSPEPGALDLF